MKLLQLSSRRHRDRPSLLSSLKVAHSIEKEVGPGVDGELYLEEITSGDRIGEGADDAMYMATVNTA